MRIRSTLLALGAVAALATPAAAQSGGLKFTADVQGPLAKDPSTQMPKGLGCFVPAAKLELFASVWNDSAQARTFRFPDPAYAVDFWIADAAGNYVAWVSGTASSAVLNLEPHDVESVQATWDQTDWWGDPVADGIYSVEAVINSSPWHLTEKQFFQIEHNRSPASAYATRMIVPVRALRPGQRIESTLRLYNNTARAQLMQFQMPFLPVKLEFTALDAAGNEVWRWIAPIPRIAYIADSFDYLDAYDSRDYGPVIFPGTDGDGNVLPAGTYTLVMKLTGQPALPEKRVTVTVSGAPTKKGTLLANAAQRVAVRAGGYSTAPRIGYAYAPSEVVVLYEGNYWNRIQATDMATGRLLTGWVRKSEMTVP